MLHTLGKILPQTQETAIFIWFYKVENNICIANLQL